MLAREWTRQVRQAEDPSGTSIPFTAPLLAGVSVRPNRHGLDYLMPNPSGGRGTYVVGWKAVSDYAAPTLHDATLARRVADLSALDAAAVREEARAVACDGFAGPLAAAAAARARSRIDAQRLRLWSRLLMAQLDGSTLTGEDRNQVLIGLGRAGPGIMTPGLSALAGRLGWEPAGLFDALGRLSSGHAAICADGRVPLLLARFEALLTELPRLLGAVASDLDELPSPLRRMVPDLELCFRHGNALAQIVMRAVEQPMLLLEAWRTDQSLPLEMVARLERAMDGWDRIDALWQVCGTSAARGAALPEMALLLRVAADRIRSASLPDPDQPVDAIEPAQHGKIPGDKVQTAIETGRGAQAAGLVERNERVRALELDLESGHG